MKRKVLQFFVLLIVFVGILMGLQLFRYGSITGFIVFEDILQGDFDGGAYVNTTYNGTSVVFSGNDLTGMFTSRVFDAGADANWNSINYSVGIPWIEFLYAIDQTADVWVSENESISWTKINDDYNNGDGNTLDDGVFDFQGNYYVFNGQDVWKSTDSGRTWTKINDDFNGVLSNNILVGAVNSTGDLFIIDAPENFWESTDSGITWDLVSENFNGGNGDILGFVVSSSDDLYAFDAASDVWESTDSGRTWVNVKDDYNAGATNGGDDMIVDDEDNLYILHNQDIWKSTDSGVSWTKINDDFNGADSESGYSMRIDSEGNFYVIDGGEDIYKSIDSGVSFTRIIQNFNGASGNIPSLESFLRYSNVTFQIRVCSLPDCSDGTFEGPDGTSNTYFSKEVNEINGTGRYFQYQSYFARAGRENTPYISNFSVDYSLLPDVLYVDDDFTQATEGWGSTHFKNITAALEVIPSGGDINVAGGNYYERLTIGDSVNLIGEGFETTVINGGGTGNVISVSSNYFNLSGFKIVGSGTNWGNSGIYLNSAGYAIIKDNYLFENRNGMSLISSSNNLIHSNYIINSTEYGIYTNNWATLGNYYYDNYFYNNVNNFYAASQNPDNYFNISKVAGTNILGGEFIGGNYWDLYSGANRGDGFGDVSYNLYGDYYDYLPLVGDFAPEINISSPAETNYVYSELISLNYSAFDSDGDLDSCWYVLNSDSPVILPDCENSSFYALLGSNSLVLYANDSTGEQSQTEVSFNLINTAPVVDITKPSGGDVYGYNESIVLTFSIEDNEGDLDSCWYNIDSGENVEIEGCLETTFDVPNGEHTLILYSNDTVGEESFDSVEFSVELDAPSISMSSPDENNHLNNPEVYFLYRADDSDLDSCEVWGDFNGIFELNQTHFGVVSGDETSFDLVLNDGNYMWGIKCNDTLGHISSSGNRSFVVDTVLPEVTITNPSGAKSSRSGIPISFSVDELFPETCIYNVYRGINLEISNTTIDCSGVGTLAVTIDADFVFNLFVQDKAGNRNSGSSSFSVSTVSSPPNNPPSGGGGGSVSVAEIPVVGGKVLNLDFSPIDELVLRRGEIITLNEEVKSNEISFLNSCKISAKGNMAGWISGSNVEGMSPGEKVIYSFQLEVPEESEPGVYEDYLVLSCEEGESISPIVLSVYRNSFEAKVLDYGRLGDSLNVNYSLFEYSGTTHDISIKYELFDMDNILRMSGNSQTFLSNEQRVNNMLKFNLPKDAFGEFVLRITFDDGISNSVVTETLFLSSSGITGLSITEKNRDTLSLAGISLIVLVIIVFFIRLIYTHYWTRNKPWSKLGQRVNRRVIRLDLGKKS